MRMRRKSNHKQLMDSGFCLFNSKSQTATLMDENKDGPLQAPTAAQGRSRVPQQAGKCSALRRSQLSISSTTWNRII